MTVIYASIYRNMFLTNDDVIKLGDLGISITVNGNLKTLRSFDADMQLNSCPEVNKGEVYTYKSEIWYAFN